MKIDDRSNKTSFGMRFTIPDKITPEQGDVLQSMVGVDFQEKEVTFAPFKDYTMFTIHLNDDVINRMASMNAYLPLPKKDHGHFPKRFESRG